MSVASVPVVWVALVSAFVDALRARGVAEATAEGMAKRVRRFAAAVGMGPAQVTREQLAAWLDGLGVAPRSVKDYRTALRAFYRWAVAEGVCVSSPVADAHASVTRYGLPERWQDALGAFERAQAAEGMRAATISARVKHVQRFAAEAGVSPWQAGSDDVLAWLGGLTCGEGTRRAHRASLRAFYGWARRSGRVQADPAALAGPGRALALPIPPVWAPELAAFTRYQRAEGRPATTISHRAAQLARFARAHASVSPWAVTLDDALEWMSGHEWAPDTRRGYRSALVTFYRWADLTGRVDGNPLANMPITRAAQPRPRPAADGDYWAALGAADDRSALALRLAGELGMRAGEVARVHSSDLEGGPGAWVLTVHGKGDRDRRLPVPDGLGAVLAARPPGYAFPGNDAGHLSPRYVSKCMSALLPQGVTLHALRHRFATRAYGIGGDLLTVQHLLGHASPATTQRYVRVSDERMRDLVRAVNA